MLQGPSRITALILTASRGVGTWLASALLCLDRQPGSLLQALSLSRRCALGGPLSARPGFFLDITSFTFPNSSLQGLPSLVAQWVKNPLANAGDPGLIPGSGRFPGEGNGNPLQYSCLENSHGQKSLVSSGPWGHKELDTTEHTHPKI